MKIQDKVFRFALIAPIALTIMMFAFLFIIFLAAKGTMKELGEARSKSVRKVLADFETRTNSYAEMLATTKAVQDAAEFDMRHYAANVIKPLYQSHAADLITIHENEGYVLVKGHEPEKFGKLEKSLSHVSTALLGGKSRGITLIDGKPALFVTVPIMSTNLEKPVGACTVGYFLDDKFAKQLSDMTGSDIIITYAGKPYSSTLKEFSPEKSGKDALAKGEKLKPSMKRLRASGKLFHINSIDLGGAQGSSAKATLYVTTDNTRTEHLSFIIVIGSITVLIALFSLLAYRAKKFSRVLADPIVEAARLAEKVASGDLEVKQLDVISSDEIGTLTKSFNTMVGNLKNLIETDKLRREYLEMEVDRLQNVMSAAAAGDLTVSFDVREEDEVGRIGASLNKMISDVREMIEKDKERREYLETQVTLLLDVMDKVSVGDFEARFDVRKDDAIGKVGSTLNRMTTDLYEMIQKDKQRQIELEQKVKGLLQGIDTAAHGDLSVSFPDNREDEFGRIGDALNRMLGDLKKKIQQIEELKRLDQNQKENLESEVNVILSAVSRTAGGDLTVRLPGGGADDAISALKRNLNEMLENLMAMIARVEESAGLVENTCRDINTTAQSLSQGSDAQKTTMENTTEAVDGMAESITTMSRHSEDVLALAGRAAEEARAGGNTATEAMQGMNLVEETMSDLHEVMMELDAGAEEIEGVVKVIDEISDQTNLLALNASIEAARAGDYGRGFAVVAKEVGSLAQKSVNSTREITLIIRRIQDRVRKAADTTELGRTRVQEGSELVSRSGEALSKIVSSVEGVTELIRKTALELETQKTDSQTILEAVKNVKLISEQSAKIINQAAATLSTLFSLAEELKNMVSQFKIS